MLTASFIFAKGMTEELERALWARGVISWEVLRAYPEEAAEVLGKSRAQKLVEQVIQATDAVARNDAAWIKSVWPEREQWRLWKGYVPLERIACVDIETTGLSAGYDQITVIGLAHGGAAGAAPVERAFVAGRPQPGDEPLERFIDAIRSFHLIITFNGHGFDLPFIERSFKSSDFHFEQPHIDLIFPARTLGLSGGLKDMEQQLGIQRGADIKEVRGTEAITLWGQWKNTGDLAAYRKLTTYCKADCTNLIEFAEIVYRRRWDAVYTPYAKPVDFAKTKGQQLTLF